MSGSAKSAKAVAAGIAARKIRYNNDPDYRAKVLAQNAKSYARISEQKRLARAPIPPKEVPKKTCAECGVVFTKRTREAFAVWESRRFCSRKCSNQKPEIFGRFLGKFQSGADGECWEWLGALNGDGYGRLFLGGNAKHSVGAHRVSWQFHKGPIPKGLHVLHRCDNRKCVNPSHLWLGTNSENVADRVSKGRSARLFGPKNPSWKGGCKNATPQNPKTSEAGV